MKPQTRWLAAACWLLNGCAAQAPPPVYPMVSQPLTVRAPVDLTGTVHQAADAMLNNLRDFLNPEQPVVAASFVEMDNVEQSSPLGRLLAHQMATRFTQRGFAMIEVQLRKNLLLKKQAGSFLLSQNLSEIQQDYHAQAALVGSYMVGERLLYVDAQLIRLRDQVTLAAVDFTLPLSGDVRTLLGLKP